MAQELNFIVLPTYNVTTIDVKDTSTYDDDPPVVDTPTLEVSVPGFDTVTVNFTPGEINILDSVILGLSTDDQIKLPDGVYVIRYSVTPAETEFVEKTILKIDQLQEKFDDAFLSLDLVQNEGFLKKQQKVSLDTIYYFIQGAIAAANNCATTEAVKLYNKANMLLSQFKSDGCCNNITFPSNFY